MKTYPPALIGAVVLLIAPAVDAGQYVYPTKGQDKARQASDESECSTWATQQTGFDPAKAPATSNALSALTGTHADTSAVTSALGAIPGSGMGGTVGQLAGGAGGGASQAVGMVTQVVGAKPQQQKPGQPEYDKARAACLIGRGYSVQ